jgi:voltage-gated potassium channel
MWITFKYFSRIYSAIAVLFFLVLIGTFGFVILEDYSFIDGFYMTVITLSTVGYGEIHPLSQTGKIFTSLLIIFSFGTFAYTITSITQYFASGEVKRYFKYYRVIEKISKLENHVIICGYGRNGTQASKTLQAHKQPFVVVESNPEIIKRLQELDLFYIEGDATEDQVLIDAGIKRSKALLSTLPRDDQNVFVVLTARVLNPSLHIISRASEDTTEKKLKTAGANSVIMPDKVGGAHMAEMVTSPDVLEFIDHISVQGPGNINLEVINFNHFPKEMQNKTLAELNIRYKTGTSIVGYKSMDGEIVVNPTGNFELTKGCKLFVLGNDEQILKLNKILDVQLS